MDIGSPHGGPLLFLENDIDNATANRSAMQPSPAASCSRKPAMTQATENEVVMRQPAKCKCGHLLQTRREQADGKCRDCALDYSVSKQLQGLLNCQITWQKPASHTPTDHERRAPLQTSHSPKRVAKPAVTVGFFLLAFLSCGMDAAGQAPSAETRLQVVTASAGPADLRMAGPTTGAVGQPIAIMVSGLPAVDLTATVGEQTKWIDSLRFDVSGPAGAVVLDKELSMSVSPWEWRLRLTLTPTVPGVYVVVCDWNQEPYGLALHRLTIGGTAPVPPIVPPIDPDKPDPPNPSETTGTAHLVIIRHNAELTADQAAELLKLRQWSDSQPDKISQLEVSPDAGSEDDRLAGYIAKAGPLPWVVLSRGRKDGKGAAVLWSGPLGTASELQAKVAEVVK
jgi:hypothetical protein